MDLETTDVGINDPHHDYNMLSHIPELLFICSILNLFLAIVNAYKTIPTDPHATLLPVLEQTVATLDDVSEKLKRNTNTMKKFVKKTEPVEARNNAQLVAVQNEMLRRVLEREFSLPSVVFMKMRPLGSKVSGTIIVHTLETCRFIPRGVEMSRKVTDREEHGWLALRLKSVEMAALVLRTCKVCETCSG